MKKIILAMGLALTFCVATAQDTTAAKNAKPIKATPEQKAQRTTDRLDKQVSLSAAQKTKVYDLALAKATKMNAIHEKYKGLQEKKEECHKEMKAMHAEYKTSLKAILNPEQAAKLDSMKHGHKKHFTPEQKAQRMVDKLDETVKLSPDQKTQVYALALVKVQKKEAIHQKYKNLDDQKEQAHTEMKAVSKEYKESLKPILTPEQAALLEAQKREHHKKGKDLKTKPSAKETAIPK